MVNYHTLWLNACNEQCPNPYGAAGEMVTALAQKLDVDQVEYDQISSTALFLLDLSTLGFRGMDINVLMVSHLPKDDDEEREQARLLSDYKIAVKSLGYCLHVVLCKERPVPNKYVLTSLEVIVVCGEDIERLFRSTFPSSVLFGIIRRQAHIEQLCPFNIDHEARGGMFKGRKEELRKLTLDMDNNYLISGARRIGKTSLGYRAFNVLRIRPEYKNRVFFFICTSWGGFYDCCSRIAHEVSPKKEVRLERGERNISYLLERASNHGSQPLIFFFDELDRVVDADASRGWQFFKMLAEASQKRWIRVVFIGYRSVKHLIAGANTTAEHTRIYSHSPFHQSLTPLNLEPLSLEETRSLIMDPFTNIEYKFGSTIEIINYIWNITNGHPFLVQFYGEKLFAKATKRNPQEIVFEDLIEIEEDKELDEQMENHFLENTIDAGRPVNAERICVFLYANYGMDCGWTQGDFIEQSIKIGHTLNFDEVREALQNLRRAVIFSYNRRKYYFTFPIMGKIIRENYPNISVILNTLNI